jgi:uncharacterized protein
MKSSNSRNYSLCFESWRIAPGIAGRIAYYSLDGFSMDETEARSVNDLWFRGSFPKSFLSDSDENNFDWRRQYIDSFLMRDLSQLGITILSLTLRRFWTKLAQVHGRIWNSSEFARSLVTADITIQRHLDIISGTSWEGFALKNVVHCLNLRNDQCYFGATHNGADLYLFVIKGKNRRGFEFKRTVSPRVTRSMQISIQDLNLETLLVIHAGDNSYPMSEKIHAVSLRRIWKDLDL